jgi:hypothetical protein
MASALFIDYNYFETSPADDANKKSWIYESLNN